MSTRQKVTRRQAQKRDTRRLILDTAYSLFAEKGYAKTTMRALAGRAGVGLGTIFKHFPDKPSLLVAAFQEDMGRIIHEGFKSMPESGIKEQLLHITRKIYDFYANDASFSRALIKESLFLEGNHGKVLDNQLTAFIIEIAKLFKMAVKNKELPNNTDINKEALTFEAFYFSTLIMGLKQPDFDTAERMEFIESMIDNHLIMNKK